MLITSAHLSGQIRVDAVVIRNLLITSAHLVGRVPVDVVVILFLVY